jgi:hypothetical protein
MLIYHLEKNDLLPFNEETSFLEITDKNFVNNKPVIKQMINLFNSEIVWKKMFDLDMAQNRILNGERMFIGVDNEIPYGYFWVKVIDNSYYIYNLFVSKSLIRGKQSGRHLLYTIIKNKLFDMTCFGEIDSWNMKSINLVKKLGFKNKI